ncbi:Response regulator receiver domain-containing protein [Pricia antarctica]|uniref:Response regulator receiver domain-containing protein n=1 Tax=Pricia antarctica TaxID=641691 RepID=A0A1G7EDJ4_9FLAO|nr:response regulator [Pricia antarctica]SDE61739.1 Response regulator receiver domain-containing protein [Pricia antarctica]
MRKKVFETPLVIWIIDDDLVSLYATRYRIKQSGSNAKVFDFDTAEIALQAYYKNKQDGQELPHIIFLDLIMPGMSGWQFLEQLAKISEARKKTQVYVLSAFSNSKDRMQAKEHTAIIGHYDKPLSRIDMDRTLLTVNP